MEEIAGVGVVGNTEEKNIEQKKKMLKDRLSKFFSDKSNLIFFAIMLFAVVLRLYYFFLTKNQPLWWDEADYMAYAKNLAGYNVDWIVSSQHNSIFPYIVALFMKIGFSESLMLLIMEVIPSIFLVFFTYKITALMYKDKRIALVSCFLMAIFWNIIFYSYRFLLEVPALFFGLLSIYVFWKGYEKKEKIFGKIDFKWAIPLAVLFVILTYATRRGYFLFGVFFFAYIILTRKIKTLIKDKYNWIGLVIALVLIFFFEKKLFISEITGVASTYYRPEYGIGLNTLAVFGTYFDTFSNVLFNFLTWFFWIGFCFVSFNVGICFNCFKKETIDTDTKSDLFNFLAIVLTMCMFIFVLRIRPEEGAIGDPRWYFPLLFSSLVCVSRGIFFISGFFEKNNKKIVVLVICVILAIAGYYQVQHADNITRIKIYSYQGIKDAGLFLKDISSIDDIIVSVPVPQPAYYAERNIINPNRLIGKPGNESTIEDFLAKIRENPKIKYVIVSFTEPNHPYWMRKENQEYNSQGQLIKLEIPFMDTIIDFQNQKQDVKQEKTYGDITFKRIKVIGQAEIFVYEIVRG